MDKSTVISNDKRNNKEKMTKTTDIENNYNIIKNYKKDFNENNFWAKIKKVAQKCGIKLICMALILYYSIPKLSLGDKLIAIGAIGYFISPLDLIPDYIPVIGYLDDLGILSWAVSVIIGNMKRVGRIDEELRNKVKDKLHSIFGEYDENIVDEFLR